MQRNVHLLENFSGKINVITGNSGSRKTAFLKAIDKYKSGVKNVKVKVQQDGTIPKEKIVLLMNDTVIAGDYHHLFQSMSEGLFIIDETSPLLLESDIGKVIAESTNYFLFIIRQLIGWLPTSIDSIYTFFSEGWSRAKYRGSTIGYFWRWF